MFGVGKIWWEKKEEKPLPNVSVGYYQPTHNNLGTPPRGTRGTPKSKMVKKYSETELRAMNPGLNDAYEKYQSAKEQYEMLLEIYESNNWKPFEKAKSI